MRLALLGLRVWSACLTIGCAQSTATDKTEAPPGPDGDADSGLEGRLIDAGVLDASRSEDARTPEQDATTGDPSDAALPDTRDGAPAGPDEVDAQVTSPPEDAATPMADAAPPSQDAAPPPPVDASQPPPPASFSYVPSNVSLSELDFTSAPGALLGCGVTQIDTSGAVTLANWCGTAPVPVIRTQSGGPEIVVIPLTGLTIAAGSSLRVVGSRPIALLVQGAASLAGAIDVSARDGVPGPGGNSMCDESKGGSGRGTNGLDGSGGGGGGFGTAGGPGGDDGSNQPGGPGIVRGTDALVPLIGGCSGGPGGGCVGTPGAGGGTIQLSVSGELAVSGSIQASGGAGAVGCSNDGGGTGGGSGGGILLEADALRISGATLGALGGRGGNGQGGAAGGAGATRAGEQGGGGRPGNGSGGSGGGGGYGRLRLRGASSCTGC